jgi:CubicO group peptidase (beta-lactamase class C family)
MALAMLVDDGLLEWDKPVREYLPAFQLRDEYSTAHMTPLDLVTHRSGLPRHDLMWYGSVFDRAELFRRLRYLEPSEELRVKWQYNNLMYMTAGLLVGKLSGSTWEQFVRQRILEPLGMSGANFSVNVSKQQADYALPYVKDEDTVREVPFREIDAMGPAGSINAGVADMALWLKLHLYNREVDGERLISPAQLVYIHTPHMSMEQPISDNENINAGYGLGWMLSAYRGHFMSQHGGGIDGFTALVTLLPNDDLGVVALSNMSATPVPNLVTIYAVDLLLGLEPTNRHDEAKAKTAEAEEMAEEGKEIREEERVEDTEPSHDLEDYAGEYEHPGYGVVKIILRDKQLFTEFHGLGGSLEHWHYDVFRSKVEDMPGDQSFLITFHTNAKGDINSLSTQLDVFVDDIEFVKVADSKLRDPEYLKTFVGEYELLGTRVTISLRGDSTLVTTVAGQPPYELKAYRGTEFVFKDLEGYAVEFIIDDDDKVEKLLIKQPNGIFTAKPVE